MGYQGTVEYKRQYTLWLLILLVILCWPAAIIYYFTRPKVPVQSFQPGYPTQPVMVAPPATTSSAPVACPTCGKPATWVAQYNRNYCYSCQKYV